METIRLKLQQQHEAFTQTVRREAAANAQALMRVNQTLTSVTERRMDLERWVKDHMKLSAGHSSYSTYYPSAHKAGRPAGASIAVGAVHGRLTSAAKGLPS